MVAFNWYGSPTRLGKGWIFLKGIFRYILSQYPKLKSGITPERLHTLLLLTYIFLETVRAGTIYWILVPDAGTMRRAMAGLGSELIFGQQLTA